MGRPGGVGAGFSNFTLATSQLRLLFKLALFVRRVVACRLLTPAADRFAKLALFVRRFSTDNWPLTADP